MTPGQLLELNSNPLRPQSNVSSLVVVQRVWTPREVRHRFEKISQPVCRDFCDRLDGHLPNDRWITAKPIVALKRPSPFLECRLDAPPADPRKGPIGRTLGTVGDVPAPGICSDRIY
jgi:hypothetical protein